MKCNLVPASYRQDHRRWQRPACLANVSKLASIKNMKRLLHEIMQWSLFRI